MTVVYCDNKSCKFNKKFMFPDSKVSTICKKDGIAIINTSSNWNYQKEPVCFSEEDNE